jgi:hypothetical protein
LSLVLTDTYREFQKHSNGDEDDDDFLFFRIKIISARGDYEHEYPNDYHEWKIQAFLKVQSALNSQIVTNLISLGDGEDDDDGFFLFVGDSVFEMEAVHIMGSEFNTALIKTIKFRENPSPEELAKQLELVAAKFEKIISNARNLKISLERKWSGGGTTAATTNLPPLAPSSAKGELPLQKEMLRRSLSPKRSLPENGDNPDKNNNGHRQQQLSDQDDHHQ